MSTKWLVLCSIIVAFVVGILLLSIIVIPVRAQCGEPQVPLCVNCHPGQAQRSVPDEWHSSHFLKATCIDCHGGNGYAAEEVQAHEGLVANPLSDIYTGCHQCHPQNYQTAASGYAATLNVTPASCATPTPVPLANLPGGFHGGNLILPSNNGVTIVSGQAIAGMAGSLVILVLFLFGLGWLNNHRLEA